jgi:hypothetical protein
LSKPLTFKGGKLMETTESEIPQSTHIQTLPPSEEEVGEDVGITAQTLGTGEGEFQATLSVSELEAQIREIETGESDPQALISKLTTLAHPLLDWDSRLEDQFLLRKCENAQKLGILANTLYRIVSQTFKWGPWVKTHFPGKSASTVQNYRDIASRPDCWPYFNWGLKRVLKLISLTRKEEGEDRIRVFLAKHGVDYDPKAPLTSEMKAGIDASLAEAGKKSKKRVSVDNLTGILKKHAEEFARVSEAELKALDGEKKGQLADILGELVTKLNS